MRLFLLSTVSTSALIAIAFPAMAADNFDFTGVGQVYYGSGTSDGSVFGADPQNYGINGKGYWNLSTDVHLQADLFYNRTDNAIDAWTTHDNASTVGGALHLLHPLDNRARIGIAGSIWNSDVFVPAGNGKTDVTYGLAAVEGQFFGSDWTVTGQAGLFSSISCSSAGGEGCPASLDSGTFVRGKVRYFLYDNTSASVETTQMWGKLNNDNGVFDGKSISSDYSQWALAFEHKFDDTPYAGIVGFEHERNGVNEAQFFQTSVDTNTIRIGFKYYLGQPTLRSNDKSGAELDTPTFGNAPQTTGPLGYVGP